MRFVPATLALLGCQPLRLLPDVPIVGGSPEQRASTRAALEAFDADVGLGRLRLREVRFEPLDAWGAYHDERILLLDSKVVEPTVVRHELCHALDYAEGLHERRLGWLEGLAGGPLRAWSERHGGDELGAVEVLATACERGPLQADLLAADCPDDEPADAWPLFAWLADVVWTHAQPFPLLDPLPGPEVSWTAPVAPTRFGVSPTIRQIDGAPNFGISGHGPDDEYLFRTEVNVATGEEGLGDYIDWDPPPEDFDLELDPEVSPGMSFGWNDGPAVVWVTAEPKAQDYHDRIVAWDGERWGTLRTGCPTDESIPPWFATAAPDPDDPDGPLIRSIWEGHGDGAVFRWHRVLSSEPRR